MLHACGFQPLLRDLRQTSTERFMKPAVVRDFLWREDVIVIGTALPKLDWVLQGVVSSCLFSRETPGNWASMV